MDNGHTEDDNFEQSFMNSVDQVVGGKAPKPVRPVQPVQPIQTASQTQPIQSMQSMQPTGQSMQSTIDSLNGMAADLRNKTSKVFLITTLACALVIVVLLVILFLVGNKPSIASDSSENVKLGNSGNVEAIGVACKLNKGTIYFDFSNRYFIETDDVEDSLVMIEDGVYKQLDTVLERGRYTVDGYELHLIADDDDDYYVEYSHHELKLKDKTYKCKNYDQQED